MTERLADNVVRDFCIECREEVGPLHSASSGHRIVLGGGSTCACGHPKEAHDPARQGCVARFATDAGHYLCGCRRFTEKGKS